MHRFAAWALLAVQSTGLVLSLGMLWFSLISPDVIEAKVQQFAMQRVEAQASVVLKDALQTDMATKGAVVLSALSRRFGVEAETLTQSKEQIVPALVAFALSDRCAPHCVIPAALAPIVESTYIQQISERRIGQQTIAEMIEGRYESTITGLLADFTRFSSVNALAFALMIGLLVFRHVLNWRFVAFSVGLTGYVGHAAYGYAFSQDWGRAILFQDWAAPAYQAAMIVACFFLADWLFLRGFITRLIGNAIATALTSFG